MNLRGDIIQVSISKGGLPKLAVPEAFAEPLGLEGDVQRHTKFHGGPRKAILLVSVEDLDYLSTEGFPVSPGGLGENLTVRGLDFRQLRSGMRLRAGAAVLELTMLRSPCSALDIYNLGGRRIQTELHDQLCRAGDPSTPRWARGGFYASVVAPGLIRSGDILDVADLAV